MKLKKKYAFSDGNQIWRLLITGEENLIIETRNIDKKEAFFNCLNIFTGKKVFKNFQLEEKYWVGIEAVYKEIIYFHRFAKPDMPGHKDIIAYDIKSGKILWETDEFSFLVVNDDKIYVFKEKFEGKEFKSLDYLSGQVIEELGENAELMNKIIYEARDKEDFSNYRYPVPYHNSIENSVGAIIRNKVKSIDIVGDIEYNNFNDFLFFNFHYRVKDNKLNNKFIAHNIADKKENLSVELNKNINAYVPDSFFCYKDLLILLRNKDEVLVFKIDS